MVLLGNPTHVTGVITLARVAEFAHPFLLMADIELALRESIGLLILAAERGPVFTEVLGSVYGSRPVPNALDRLTIGDYKAVLTHRRTAARFRPVFGGNVGPRLDRISELRNSLFHFRSSLTVPELHYLEDQRTFFRTRLSRVNQLQADRH